MLKIAVNAISIHGNAKSVPKVINFRLDNVRSVVSKIVVSVISIRGNAKHVSKVINFSLANVRYELILINE